jgi:CheY-like chemotaxis protein
MLSSATHIDDAHKCRDLGIWRYLVKPVFQHELLHTILEASQIARPRTPVASAGVTFARGTGPALRILLAEDNPVNQKVTVRVLERKGHIVVVAPNGREAVTFASQERFDLILMDIQMPEMDGISATVAIREKERENGKHLPIIAVTAHAMKGDKERCLDAGMDAYITKPIKVAELLAAIERVMSPCDSSAPAN